MTRRYLFLNGTVCVEIKKAVSKDTAFFLSQFQIFFILEIRNYFLDQLVDPFCNGCNGWSKHIGWCRDDLEFLIDNNLIHRAIYVLGAEAVDRGGRIESFPMVSLGFASPRTFAAMAGAMQMKPRGFPALCML